MLVLPYFAPHVGGVEQFARQLGLALVATQRWEVHVVTSGDRGWRTRSSRQDGLTISRLGWWWRFSYTPVSPAWPWQIRRLIRQWRPDLINAHSPVPLMADCAVLVAGPVPVFLTYHAATLQKDSGPVFELARRLYSPLQAAVFRRCAAVLAVSEYVRASLQPLDAPLVTFSNALDPGAFLPETPPGASDRFLFMARLNREHSWKGLDHVLRALQFAPEARLVVGGDGDMRPHYQTVARQLGVDDRVDFLGSIDGDAKRETLLSCAALIAYPTTSNDAFPTVLLEAWAAWRPVIVSDIGPMPSLVDDGVTGLVVEPAEPAVLGAAMRQICHDPDSADRLGRAGRDSVSDLTWENQAFRFEELAAEVIGTPALRARWAWRPSRRAEAPPGSRS